MDEPAIRKSLVIWWSTGTNEIELEVFGLSIFDVVGLLEVAHEIAVDGLPSVRERDEDA